MNKKQLVKKLNSQKGITGADVAIALLIILTAIGVIAMIYVNLVIGSREVNRKGGATRIATNIIENLSQIYYDEIAKQLQDLVQEKQAEQTDNRFVISGKRGIKAFKTSIPKGYTVEIALEDAGEYDVVKKATITVKYKVDGQEQTIDFSKVLTREVVRECNSPKFEPIYISQMTTEDWELYTQNSKDAYDIKIICPIQYDTALEAYQVVTDTDSLWYSYANKQWARALVLNPEEVEHITPEMVTGENSYVWIPRFGVEEGGELFGNTYFKYKTTDYAILNSQNATQTNLFYNYIDNHKHWSDKIDFEEGLAGKWCQYAELSDSQKQTLAYSLNQSQYGPMLEY